MKKSFSTPILYLLILSFLTFVTMIFVNVSITDNPEQPKVLNGSIDLTRWDFNKTVKLDGDWEFYWNQLLEPIDFQNQTQKDFLRVPMGWNRSLDEKHYVVNGYATYRLTIKAPPHNNLALRIPRIFSSYKLWINDSPMSSCGVVSTDFNSSYGKTMPDTIIFNSNNNIIKITINVSNHYDSNEGGIVGSFFLGDYKQILKERDKQVISDIFLFGLIFTIGCYHFILYSFRRKETSTLFFGIFCMVISLRVVTTGECLFLRVVDIKESTFFRINYAYFGIGCAMLQTFYYTLFPKKYPRIVLRALQIFNMVCILITTFLGSKTPFIFTTIYEIVNVLAGVYTICIIIHAWRHKQQSSLIIFFGTIIFLAAIVNDLLNAEQIIFTNIYIPVGLSIFIFIQSTVLALRFSDAMKKVETLSEEKSRHQAQLIGGVSHNLKTPIMIIAGTCEKLMDLITEYKSSIGNKQVTIEDHYEIADDMKTRIEVIKPQCTYMSRVINSIKSQATNLSNNSSNEFTIGDLIKDVNLLTNKCIKKCSVNIFNNTSDDIKIKGSLISIVQIINNLIQNSIEAYRDQSGTIEIFIEEQDDMILLKITDYAGGVDENIKGKLLNEMITTKGDSGTGLGLYMSYNTIKGFFGGEMWFDSSTLGTTFYISIPKKINN